MSNEEKQQVDETFVTPWNLAIYYRRIFPSHIYCKWLAYGEPATCSQFAQREFSFTLENDVYRRYLSFSNHMEFEKELIKLCPEKIDIGAVYSAKPKDHKMLSAAQFYPIERELVFDIDMTDYDDVRFCCRGADICSKCWTLMRFAMQIMDRVLHEDFGFEHRLWIYSGRRGVHCWVCDQTARELQSSIRQAIVEHITIVTGGKDSSKRVTLYTPLHPSLQRAREIILTEFDGYACLKQDFLGDDQRIERFLRLVPDDNILFFLILDRNKKKEESINKVLQMISPGLDYDESKNDFLNLKFLRRQTLRELFSQLTTSAERWAAFKQHTDAMINSVTSSTKYRKSAYTTLIDEIMFEYCYPRLDANVTKGMNHLLKSPFSIHPKTGRVSIPIHLDSLAYFDPCKEGSVPKLNELCQQVEQLPKQNLPNEDGSGEKTATKQKDYNQTSLKPFIDIFARFVQQSQTSKRNETLARSDLNTMLSGEI
ncbi:unnamed protein product [Rotaria magnacalcarata]|uniref:DNA primase n=1 Tax=Rotaria magnacalcarata TaxID=392030 RepID=A0A816TIJ7_9BILA|nr:unnamed protein product [Rotaria magnacalcarata]CAF1626797.1 unnamed protein product [Rotaria magnacalcarata]CAF2091233.1 unnamed protein product [Rotaria magnacalcarata]CAF2098597.1 unnamed protein product [Rotaria magnacalcarata]CAF3815036.1 unnamed protein product [Rotaria magnacalcarata]